MRLIIGSLGYRKMVFWLDLCIVGGINVSLNAVHFCLRERQEAKLSPQLSSPFHRDSSSQ
jgi:hypothetical protein